LLQIRSPYSFEQSPARKLPCLYLSLFRGEQPDPPEWANRTHGGFSHAQVAVGGAAARGRRDRSRRASGLVPLLEEWRPGLGDGKRGLANQPGKAKGRRREGSGKSQGRGRAGQGTGGGNQASGTPPSRRRTAEITGTMTVAAPC